MIHLQNVTKGQNHAVLLTKCALQSVVRVGAHLHKIVSTSNHKTVDCLGLWTLLLCNRGKLVFPFVS